MSNLKTIAALIEGPIEAMGYEMLHLEFGNQGKDRVLRIYIDAPGGILVDDCESVSRQVSAILDVEDPVDSAYMLEVSSPGLDRPLVKPVHFKQFVGGLIKAVTHSHVLGRRRFKGRLTEASDENVTLECDGEVYELAYGNIESARLEPEF
ncbi:MAG: ribosome maturation factor RimP [Pseudomonadota bacterium]